MQYILPNKLLWYIAIANVFVYLLRYGILDWSPTYLKEVKHFALDKILLGPISCTSTRDPGHAAVRLDVGQSV